MGCYKIEINGAGSHDSAKAIASDTVAKLRDSGHQIERATFLVKQTGAHEEEIHATPAAGKAKGRRK